MQKNLEDIRDDFIKNLEIPLEIPQKQFFFCPVGLVGVGKSTVTKPISKRFNLLRLSSDEIRKLLLENGYDYGPVKDIGFDVVRKFVKKGYSISFDMDCGNPTVKTTVEDLAREYGIKVIWVHINPPEEYVFEKFRNFPIELSWLAPGQPQVMIDNYLAQKERRMQEHTSFDFIYTFDTSKKNISEQIEECSRLISENI
jgi:predicted kinase